MTLPEYIHALKKEIGDATTLSPLRASQILVELSSLHGNINDEIRAREMLYKHKLVECYEVEQTANRAKLRAETTPEYRLLREYQDLGKLVEELKRSLKYFIRIHQEEMTGYRNN